MFMLGPPWCTDAGGWSAIGDSGWYSTLGVSSAGGRKVSCCVTSVGVALGGRETAVLVILPATRVLLDPRCEIQPHRPRLWQIPEVQTHNTDGLVELDPGDSILETGYHEYPKAPCKTLITQI